MLLFKSNIYVWGILRVLPKFLQAFILAKVLIQQNQFSHQLSQNNLYLKELAYGDELTKVANRRYFDQYLSQEWRRMAREKQPLSLILIDIDCFKKFNDTFGHVAGDRCLQKVASAIGAAVNRPGDLVARYGGEEFAIILPNTHLSGASYLAKKVRSQIENLQIQAAPHAPCHYVSISAGVATIGLLHKYYML